MFIFFKKVVSKMQSFSNSSVDSKNIAKVSRGWSSFMG